MNDKGIGTGVVVLIVIIAVASIGIYFAISRSGGGGAGPKGENAASAVSLSFKVVKTGAISEDWTVWLEGIGRLNYKMRFDGVIAGVESKIILEMGENKARIWAPDNGWQDVSSMFSMYFDRYNQQANTYMDQLSGWTGGDWTYTDPSTGASVRIHDIQVNPSIPDSTFQPS